MDFTYCHYFNYYLKQLLNDILKKYPHIAPAVLANYRPLLENKVDATDLYAKCYFSKIAPFLADITARNPAIFTAKDQYLLEGIDFYYIWNNHIFTDDNKTSLWKYLQILMALSHKIIPNHSEIIQLVKDIGDGIISTPVIPPSFTATSPTDDNDTESGGFDNIVNMLSGGNPDNLTNLASNVFSKMVNNFMPASTPPTPAQSTTVPPTPPPATEQQPDATPPHGKGILGEMVSDFMQAFDVLKPSTDTPTDSPAVPSQQPSGDADNASNATSDNEEDGKLDEMMNTMNKLFSDENRHKMGDLFKKYNKKIKDEYQNGNINPATMLKEVTSALTQNNPEMKQQMNAMFGNLLGGNSAAKSSTKDRLKRKLHAKQPK